MCPSIRRIKLTFKKSSGQILETVEANEGDDIVDVSWEYDLDIEGQSRLLGAARRGASRSSRTGEAARRSYAASSNAPPELTSGAFIPPAACEKSIACSTCHIILEPDLYDTLEEPSDDENE